MKAQRLLFLNSLTCALIPFSNIDIDIHHSKELTVQCAQIGEQNVWVTECWFAGQCERKFSVTTRAAIRSKCFDVIFLIFLNEDIKLNKENFKQTIDDFFRKKALSP